jgi:hypothetical protein
MRDPYKVVVGRSTMLSPWLRLRAAWEAFECKHKNAYTTAETYGTPDCVLDTEVVSQWKAAMKKVLGARAPPAVKMKPRWVYISPLDPELIEAWIQKANGPDDVIPDWIQNGAPLGIETEIPYRGIFPKNTDENNLDHHSGLELEDAAAQLGKGYIVNYTSVQDNPQQQLRGRRKHGGTYSWQGGSASWFWTRRKHGRFTARGIGSRLWHRVGLQIRLATGNLMPRFRKTSSLHLPRKPLWQKETRGLGGRHCLPPRSRDSSWGAGTTVGSHRKLNFWRYHLRF